MIISGAKVSSDPEVVAVLDLSCSSFKCGGIADTLLGIFETDLTLLAETEIESR